MQDAYDGGVHHETAGGKADMKKLVTSQDSYENIIPIQQVSIQEF